MTKNTNLAAFVVTLAGWCALGCSGSAGDGPGPNADAGVGPLAAAIELRAQPGDEETVCISMRLDNPERVWVREIRTQINAGSHHMIIYRTTEAEESLTPEPCTPFVGDVFSFDVSAPLFIAQQAEAALTYPEGTALPLQPNQMIRIEFHYINYFPDPKDLLGEVEFVEHEGDTSELQAVDMIFWGTTDIEIDPRSSGEASMYHRVDGPNSLHPDPIQIFGLTSHTHQWGTRATLERTTGLDALEGELLHESLDWSEPPLDLFDPPLTFDGTDGLRLVCEYMNGSDQTVTFGEGFNDEMCFLWAYYFPSRGFLIDF